MRVAKRNCLEMIRIIGSVSVKKQLLVARDRDIYRTLREELSSKAPDFLIIKGIIEIFQKLIVQRLIIKD